MDNSFSIRPIKSLIVLLTNRCNLACPYCFESKDSKRMSLEVAKDVLHFLHNNSNTPSFTFFGGEPTLEWDSIMRPLIEYSHTLDNPTRFSMTTNGTMLDEERVDYLINNNVSFLLSMDGQKFTQDINRPMRSGKSGFDKLEIILPYILSKRPHQEVRATLTGLSVKNLFDDILWFETIGVKSLMIEPNVYEVMSDSYKNELYNQIQRYEEYIINSFRAGIQPLLFRGYAASFWRIKMALSASGRRNMSGCAPTQKCGFGILGSGSSDVNGNIYGCHHVGLDPDSIWCIGNIYDGVNEEKVRTLVAMYNEQMVGNEQCALCPLDNICDGGCTPNNWMTSGDMHKVPETFCYWTRCITDSAYRVCQVLGNESNALFSETFATSNIRR